MKIVHSNIRPKYEPKKVVASQQAIRVRNWISLQNQKNHELALLEFADEIKELQEFDPSFTVKPLLSFIIT